MSIYQLTGNARDQTKKLGVSDIHIQVRGKQGVLAETVTDQTGQFTMRLQLSKIEQPLRKDLEMKLKNLLETNIKRLPKGTPSMKERINRLKREHEKKLEKELVPVIEKALSDVTVDVFHQDQPLKTAKVDIKWNHPNRTGTLEIMLDVTEIDRSGEGPKQEETTQSSELHVRGHVLQADGTPLTDVIVRTYHQRLRAEELLAEVHVDKDGQYEIYDKITSELLNLKVRVFDREGTELGSSPVLYHASFQEQVDIVVSSEKVKLASEFEIVQQKIATHLDGADPASLSDEEVRFLEQQTGLRPQQITHYVLANQLHQETQAPLETLYGTLRVENPVSLTEFLVKDSDTLVRAAQEAVKLNVISESRDEKTFINQLEDYSVKHVLESTPQVGVGAQLGSLVKLTGLTTDQQHKFIKHALDFKGDASMFWQETQQQGILTEKATDDLQTTLQLGAITAGHLPLTTELKKQFDQGQFHALRDLSRLSQPDWLKMIEGSADGDESSGVPEGIVGENEADRRTAYARVLSRTVEDAFPTAVFAEQLRQDQRAESLYRDLLQTLDANQNFDLGAMPIEQYIEHHPDLLKGAQNPDERTDGLKRVRRAFLLAPRFERYDAVKALLDDQVDSATRVASMDQETFILAYSVKLGGAARAQAVHKNALQRAGMVQTLIANHGSPNQQGSPTVIPSPAGSNWDSIDWSKIGISPEASSKAKAKWENLFGRMDHCDCDHCRSVYSPAAYLTDLLHFLRDRPAGQQGLALELLFERRPDIGGMLLNCQNTNTTLPYIDLVNEVLEEHVLQMTDKKGKKERNTTLTGDELRAHPEYLQTAAYEELNQAVYPWSLPFHLFARETDLYLAQAGIDRAELMALAANDSSDLDTRVAIACQRLTLPPSEYKLISGTHPESNLPHLFWNFVANSNWLQTLQQDIPTVLARAQLTFKECLELLSLEYINPNGLFGIRFSALDETEEVDLCNLEQAWFAFKGAPFSGGEPNGLFAAMLDRFHRFVRLQRALGWSAYDLDIAIAALSEGASDPLRETVGYSLIADLADVVSLQAKTELSIEELLSWFGDINTRPFPSTSEPVERQPLYAQLFLNRTVNSSVNESFELSNTGQLSGSDADRISGQAETIQSVLRISARELEALQSEALDSNTLSLAHLSVLYRHASLARTLGISITELLAYKKLIEHDPFASVRDAIAWIDVVEEARTTSVSVEEWSYLLRHTGKSEAQKMDEVITNVLTDIQKGVAKIYKEQLTDDESTSEEEQERLLSVCQQRSEQWVKEKLASLLTVDAQASQHLVELIKLSDQSAPVYQAILDSELLIVSKKDPTETTEQEPSRAEFQALYDGIVRLKKAGRIVQRLEISGADLPQLVTGGTDGHWLDLRQLPTSSGEMESSLAAALLLSRAVKKQQTAPHQGERKFLDVLELASRTDADAAVLHSISDYFGWDEQALATLVGPDGLNLSLSQLTQINTLERLDQIFDLLLGAPISVESLLSLQATEMTEATARRARLAAKAKYNEQAWLPIAEEIRNTLREEQRQALVDYIVARSPNLSDGNDLLGHLLIDVEMSSCKQTSRITQAISSTQLFVQRCLMNLEEAGLSPADAKEWKEWRKRYRVWEANRKIFLYPENWIEPELRTEKSPFFKELEDELMQGDVTTEAVEEAYRGYMEKLMEVSNLEVAGVCHETEPGTGTDIVHVFARTRNVPRVYFYRQRINDARWTAWEKLELDIEGDHLIPTIFNRRLTLFWPIFTEQVEEELPDENASNSEKTPKRHWEIKLAWSVFQAGKWSAKQTTEDVLDTKEADDGNDFPTKESVFFQVQGTSVACYRVMDSGRQYYYGSFTYDYQINQMTKQRPIEIEYYMPVAGVLTPHMMLMSTMDVDKPSWVHEGMALRLTRAGKLILPYENHAGEVLHQVVFDKASSYLLLPEATENAAFRARGVFFVIDKATHRTFFVRPENQFEWRPRDFFGGGLIPHVDTDVIGNWDEFASGLVTVPDLWSPNLQFPEIDLPHHQNLGLPGQLMSGGLSPIMSTHTAGSPVATSSPEVAPLITQFYSVTSSQMTNWRPGEEQLIGKNYAFQTFFHPFVPEFNKNLIRYGVDGLLDPKREDPIYRQQLPNHFEFSKYELQGSVKDTPPPVADVDFSADGAYSIYNWELFFHIPFLIGTRLSENQRFEEAQTWFHAIFDPTTPETGSNEQADQSAQRFWKVKPFYEEEIQRLREMLLLINRMDEVEAGDSAQEALLASLVKQVEEWEKNPFDPNVIAQMRPIAYMKAVVMKYIDNLIAWGDLLFQQATRESIDEATHVYALAAQILGERPQSVPAPRETVALSFQDLLDSDALDLLSNAEIELDDLLPHLPVSIGPGIESSLPIGRSLFFCIPKNEKLAGYWNTVEDRLFKIRHCLDIDGQAQQLPLFAPPIDPGMLVAAAASGADISRAIGELHAPLPHYRYQTMHRKAVELCQDVKGLGGALLSALEKRDGETIAKLRATHGLQLQQAGLEIRMQRIEEAKEAVTGLELYREVIQDRKGYYEKLIKEGWNGWETAHFALTGAGATLRGISQLMQLGAAPVRLLPDVTTGIAGTFGTPVATATLPGGQKSADSVINVSGALAAAGSILESGGQLASVLGSYARREEDWAFQKGQADKELKKMDIEIIEANIRVAIAERELENTKLQIEQAKAEEDYLVSKFTNEDLYQWMVTQLSTLYFQSYELAYATAKRAEKTYQFELGRHEETFITFGNWDNLRRGLLSGERLHLELQRMDVAYLNNDRREFELNKDVSLLQLDPYQLLRLRETGMCEIHLPETVFDQDYPGHYMRRIKAVRMTIPCVSGPYTSVNATLTLTKGKTRMSSDPNTDIFHETIGAFHTMATSHAQQDAGLFELNFEDARYLPFEGAGAESSWLLELPKDTNRFNFATISDILLHVSYTSRDGGKRLQDAGRLRRDTQLKETGLTATYSAKQHLSAAWHEFLHSPNPQTQAHELQVELLTEGFPSTSEHRVRFDDAEKVYLLLKTSEELESDRLTLSVGDHPITLFKGGSMEDESDEGAESKNYSPLEGVNTIFIGELLASDMDPADWTITLSAKDIPNDLIVSDAHGGPSDVENHRIKIEDLWIVCQYTLETKTTQ